MFNAQEKQRKQDIIAKNDQHAKEMQTLANRLQTVAAANAQQSDLINSLQGTVKTILDENKALKMVLDTNKNKFQEAKDDWHAQLTKTTESLKTMLNEQLGIVTASQKEQFDWQMQQVEDGQKQQIEEVKHDQTSFK